MINITFPDNSVRKYEKGITPYEIAKSISNSLAREVLSASLDDEIIEVHTCLLYTSPSPRDQRGSRMPSSA